MEINFSHAGSVTSDSIECCTHSKGRRWILRNVAIRHKLPQLIPSQKQGEQTKKNEGALIDNLDLPW
jgi:hypothetical protein